MLALQKLTDLIGKLRYQDGSSIEFNIPGQRIVLKNGITIIYQPDKDKKGGNV